MHVQIETIGPEQAETLLATQYDRQRNVKRGAVDRFAADMKAGRWDPDSTIKIDTAGRLIDGQHRLLAVLKSGASVQFIVARGVETKSVITTDTGTARTLGDTLRFQGEANASSLAAGLSSVVTYLVRGVFSEGGAGKYVSRQQAIDLLDSDPEIRDWIAGADRLGRTLRFPPGILTGFAYVASRSKSGNVNVFFDRVASGVSLGEDSPELVARKVLERRRNTAAMRRYDTGYYMDQFVQAWNAHAKGSPTVTLRHVTVERPTRLFDPEGALDEWRNSRRGMLGINGSLAS